jgi:PAS domain-containing protein
MASPVIIELTDWSLAQQQVLAGEADALLQINPSPERLELYDFSDPLLGSKFSIFIAADRVGVFTLEDLQGLQVGVEERGLPVMLLRNQPGIRTEIIADIPTGFAKLVAGSLEAVIVDRRVGGYLLAENRIRGVSIIEQPVITSQSTIAVKKGNTVLLAEINRALAEIRRDGTYDAIIHRWQGREVVFKTREQVSQVNWSLAVVSAALLFSLAGLLVLGREVRRRVRAEKALEFSESRFRIALESSGAALWDWDLANKRVDFSPRWFFLRGLVLEGANDHEEEWSKGVHPGDWPRLQAALHAHFSRDTEVFFRDTGCATPTAAGGGSGTAASPSAMPAGQWCGWSVSTRISPSARRRNWLLK